MASKDYTKYEFGLTLEELEKRTNKDYLTTMVLLKADAPEYLQLEEGDKKALKHLVKAGAILENIHYQLDNHRNLGFMKFLDEEIKKGNKQAKLTKILLDG